MNMNKVENKGSGISSALQGIQNGLQRVAEAADKISGGPASNEDTVGAIIDLKQGARDVEVNRRVLSVLTDLEKSVIDILA